MLLAALLVACAPATPSPVPTSALEGTDWALLSLNGQALLEGTHISIRFKAGELSGFAGCNAYGGGSDSGGYVATDDGTLTVSQTAITLMACLSPEGVMEQEQAYIEALRSAARYRLADDRLEIRDAAGETILVFARQERYAMDPAGLPGTAWQLVSMDGREPAAGSEITLAFHDAHRASGHAGCRDYVLGYGAESDELHFHYTGMMGALCSGDALLEQEGAYTTLLTWVRRYHVTGDRLELHTVRGEVLVYEPLPASAQLSLESPTWRLVAFVEENVAEGIAIPLSTDALDGTEITASFDEGTLSGSAGCNSYGTAYTSAAASLALDAVAATEMACPSPEGVMAQEQRYLQVLRDVTAYHVYGTRLWLETDDGRALVFARGQTLANLKKPWDI
jgi:heat shock protein HslJ